MQIKDKKREYNALSFQEFEEATKGPKDEFGQRGGKGRFRRGCWSHKEGGFSRSSPIKK